MVSNERLSHIAQERQVKDHGAVLGENGSGRQSSWPYGTQSAYAMLFMASLS